MGHGWKWTKSVLLSAALMVPLATIGCAEHHAYRVYDADYSDYHNWDANERVYYNQWETETHRPDRDFRKRSPDEQKDYWSWRHKHPDRDHDHDQH